MAEKRRVTIEDVARKAGVSAMTISRVLNRKREISPATREHVLGVMRELNYRPSRVARSLATSKTFTIGVVVPDITNLFFASIVRGIEDAAWEHNYSILLCNSVEDQARERAALSVLEETQADGIILCSPRLPDDQLFPQLKQYSSAVVFNRRVPASLASVVIIDDVEGGRQAANHLLRNGRQRLACLNGPQHSFSGQARLRGLKQAVAEAAYPLDPALQSFCMPTWEGGYSTTLTLLNAHPQIDGLICFNDLVAVGAIQACLEVGRPVPDDIAIVGFDDTLLARTSHPTLTTLRASKYEIGVQLMHLLLDQIQGRSKPDEIVIKPELIIRASAPVPMEEEVVLTNEA